MGNRLLSLSVAKWSRNNKELPAKSFSTFKIHYSPSTKTPKVLSQLETLLVAGPTKKNSGPNSPKGGHSKVWEVRGLVAQCGFTFIHMLRFYCVLGWSPRNIDRAPSSCRETVSKWDIQRPLKTCSCFPICLPWLRMFNKGLHRHRWRWLTGKRPLPPRLMAWIWFLGPTWRKERVNSPRFCSQTTTCVLWHVYTYTYFTHIKNIPSHCCGKAADKLPCHWQWLRKILGF